MQISKERLLKLFEQPYIANNDVPGTPASGYAFLYFNESGQLCRKNYDGSKNLEIIEETLPNQIHLVNIYNSLNVSNLETWFSVSTGLEFNSDVRNSSSKITYPDFGTGNVYNALNVPITLDIEYTISGKFTYPMDGDFLIVLLQLRKNGVTSAKGTHSGLISNKGGQVHFNSLVTIGPGEFINMMMYVVESTSRGGASEVLETLKIDFKIKEWK